MSHTPARPSTAALYALFFVSGAVALVYEVTWARSLGLVFGASHLAVTTVLAVYMGGQALGGALAARRDDPSRDPLRLYGFLEIGVGVCALAFIPLMKGFPVVYAPLARLAYDQPVYLTTLRVVFAVVAMAAPTTLMGATLPILARFVSGARFGSHLSSLYALNTAGAMAGTAGAGFFLLRAYGVTATLVGAGATSIAVGFAAIALSRRQVAAPYAADADADAASDDGKELDISVGSRRAVLWGIAASGFCALGYEVLWTRMLSMVLGTSVYSFTIMLVAFLAGIALGSKGFSLVQRARPRWARGSSAVLLFGVVQVAIGAAAAAVTLLMRDLPGHAIALQNTLVGSQESEFGARLGASFATGFVYMFVPALLMGFAFPLAGVIVRAGSSSSAKAIGNVVAFNTTGAILGSAVSGFVLIYLFGIERSLQVLILLNVAVGLSVASTLARRVVTLSTAATALAAAAVLLSLPPAKLSWWDLRYFAVFRNNQRNAFETPQKVAEALENTDVLYYHQGVNETISVIQPKGFMRAFVVNGRPEASTSSMDRQCQRTLGHLPMLLHPDPKKVFVLGTGTGMTLGATSIHPEVDRIVLAEIELGALGAARQFADYNHRVLEDPRLEIVHDDGRNFLRTTQEKFDVITADPIHPWSGGAAYLYTSEYFRSVADRLRPGGIACQWLPIYELTERDLATAVRTFAAQFAHTALWLTHYDAELVGSNDPIAFDEEALARRIAAAPRIREDLADVEMGSAEDFLSYFVFGTAGARAFASAGTVNTDDNLVLEFSAAESVGVPGLPGTNTAALARHRESLAPYLARAGATKDTPTADRWGRVDLVAREYDAVHAEFLLGRRRTPEFRARLARLKTLAPSYAPLRFLGGEVALRDEMDPAFVAGAAIRVLRPNGAEDTIRVSAVTMRTGYTRAVAMFVDNDRRVVFGERYVDAPSDRVLRAVRDLALEKIHVMRTEYASSALQIPTESELAARLEAIISGDGGVAAPRSP